MPSTEIAEGALVVFVNRALHVTADAAHQMVATPATAAIEGIKSATVFVASHLIVGGIQLGCTASWWLLTSAAAAIGTGASIAYYGLFGTSEAKYIPVGQDSDDMLFQDDKLSPRSSAMDVCSPAQTNSAAAAAASLQPSVMDID